MIKYDEYHYSIKNILSVSVFDPRIQSEKEKLSVFVSAVSVRIRSVFIPTSD
jgi:glycosylphosphatidylinositol transamidase (GPIT) subunit GPI8